MADILGTIGNKLGLTNSGEITPLIIKSYANIERTKEEIVFEAYINPDEYSLNYNVIADKETELGRNGSEGTFIGTEPLEVTLKFFLDGTNVVPIKKTGDKLDVKEKIGDFHKVIGYEGDIHRPRFLRLIWGKGAWLRTNQDCFDCYLKTASFQYKLFDKDGTPLRAIITATFLEALPKPPKEAAEGNSSPDLTHVRVVKEGDTLPAMTGAIYGDFRYYLEVARINNLQDFRNLPPGKKLFFPPFDKNKKNN